MTERTEVLKNGVKVYSFKNASINSFAISLFAFGGPLYENEKENGFSHFFEHMVFKNINALMNGRLYQTLDLYGLSFNAATYESYIEFTVSGAKNHLSDAAKIISLALSPFVISSAQISTESKRIKAEIYENSVSSLASISRSLIYEGSPLARPITGYCQNIDNFGIKMLNSKHKEIISKENIFFYIGGNYDESDYKIFKECIEAQKVSDFPMPIALPSVPEKFGNRNCTCVVRNASSTSVNISFDVNTAGYTMPEIYCLCDTLYGGESSPVYSELSEKTGFTYDFEDDLNYQNGFAVLSVSYEVRGDRLMKSLDAFFTMLSQLRPKLGSRLPLILPYYTDNIYIKADRGEDITCDLGYYNHILGQSFLTLEDMAQAFQKVVAERINELAMRTFRPENLVITVKGNPKGIGAEKIRKLALEKLK